MTASGPVFSTQSSAPVRSVGVVGGGLVGLATARSLRAALPHARVVVWEKEAELGQHQSTHNSGVLHAGLYYKPGSLKAQLAVSGIRRMVEFCREHGVRHEICGKLVLATDETEVARLRVLFERGQANGLRGLRWLAPCEFRDIEPEAAGVAAVHVPEEGIVDYAGVCAALRRDLESRGVEVRTRAPVLAFRREALGWTVVTAAGDWSVDRVVNCAGLHCDRIARLAGAQDVPRIVPFRGEYYRLRPEAERLVRHLIYPVPDPRFPFLGVHFTRMASGGVEAGPNAVLALAREGYSWRDFAWLDAAEAVTYPGLWRFMARHARMSAAEIHRSVSRRRFCASLRRLVPAISEADLEDGPAGVRAQAMLRDGTLVQDFHFVELAGMLHVLNAPSPGATASLAIGDHVVRRLLAQ